MGNVYLLVLTNHCSDHCSKWAVAYAIPNQEAITVAQKLIDEFFCCFLTPEQLHAIRAVLLKSG